jgi:hypothetical protein
VLYSVPKSLSVPQERDNVRKVVEEARERLRVEQARDSAAASGIGDTDLDWSDRPAAVPMADVDDPDAMELD